MANYFRRIEVMAILMLGICSAPSRADEVVVKVSMISATGIGDEIGTITIADSHHGVTITPNLKGLPPGKHAFHVHENPDCGPGIKGGKPVAGLKAGGHYDPTGAAHHMGHKPHGDLSELTADPDGTATKPVRSGTLKVAMVRGRSIMVHRFGEDEPGKPKGGGDRMACGVIPR
jgi:Cu-Zn family superoxide dismutase